ncbi:MAG: hypothetical protein ACI9YL_000956 [Luteibaculaceae bacterium]|jgi:hypothetical protein
MKLPLLLATALILSSCCFELETPPICPEYLDEEECRLFQLPKATTSGANNVGAIVNDQVWVSNQGKPTIYGSGGEEIFGDLYNSTVYLKANRYVANDGKCCPLASVMEGEIKIDSLSENEPYFFDVMDSKHFGQKGFDKGFIWFEYLNEDCPCDPEGIDSIRHFGDIRFTRIDTLNKIFSGHFYFQQVFFGSGCSDTLVVRNGVFDVKL